MPANLNQPCPDLAPLPDARGRTVIGWAATTIEMYQNCQDKVEGLRAAWPRM